MFSHSLNLRPAHHFIFHIKHDRCRVFKSLSLTQLLPPSSKLRILRLPLSFEAEEVNPFNGAAHSNIRNGVGITNEPTTISRLHVRCVRFHGASDLSILSPEPSISISNANRKLPTGTYSLLPFSSRLASKNRNAMASMCPCASTCICFASKTLSHPSGKRLGCLSAYLCRIYS